jgi:hypothetical protein
MANASFDSMESKVGIVILKQRPEEDSGLVDEGKSFNLNIRP